MGEWFHHYPSVSCKRLRLFVHGVSKFSVLSVAEKPFDRAQHLLRLIAVRGVPAVFENQSLNRT